MDNRSLVIEALCAKVFNAIAVRMPVFPFVITNCSASGATSSRGKIHQQRCGLSGH